MPSTISRMKYRQTRSFTSAELSCHSTKKAIVAATERGNAKMKMVEMISPILFSSSLQSMRNRNAAF